MSAYANDPRVTRRRTPDEWAVTDAGREFDLSHVREPSGTRHPTLVEAFDTATGDRVHGIGRFDDVIRALIGDPQ